ncbi:MAG: transporter [Bacteroidia bacterium]|nr:transporter [Bacteroidia bacterium]NNJ54972.1 transporter [Bacteroidia bacterium]
MKRILSVLLLFAACYCNAQIETDRPDFTESPNVVPKGALQIETGFVFENDLSAKEQRQSKIQLSERNYTVNTTLFRYGLTENIELRLNTNYTLSKVGNTNDIELLDSTHNPILSDIKGFQTSFIGFKTNLYKNDKLSLGFLGHLYIPALASGDFIRTVGQRVAPEFLVPATLSLNERWGISGQFGMAWDGLSSDPSYNYNLGVGFGISEKVGSYLEAVSYFTAGEELAFLNGGFTYLVTDNFQLDLTGGYKLTEAAPDYFLSCGLSYRMLKK